MLSSTMDSVPLPPYKDIKATLLLQRNTRVIDKRSARSEELIFSNEGMVVMLMDLSLLGILERSFCLMGFFIMAMREMEMTIRSHALPGIDFFFAIACS